MENNQLTVFYILGGTALVFTSVEEIVHWARTKRAGLKGSYTDGRVKYFGMAMCGVM